MHFALIQKFTQHSDLQSKLFSTADKILVEHTTNDNFWADGGNGSGKNWLGRLLMFVRRDLKFYKDNFDKCKNKETEVCPEKPFSTKKESDDNIPKYIGFTQFNSHNYNADIINSNGQGMDYSIPVNGNTFNATNNYDPSLYPASKIILLNLDNSN